MLTDADVIKLLFGFKLRYLRQNKGFSLEALAAHTNLSKSYLHDLERGKKYPKVDKITKLAKGLGVDFDYLVSQKASRKLQPVIDLLSSDLLKEFPLEEFGVATNKLVELLVNSPERVHAFIGTIMNLTRHYQLDREHFYFTALRSYQNLHDNYFPALEVSSQEFRQQFGLAGQIQVDALEGILKEAYQISVDRVQLNQVLEKGGCRSYYAAASKTLFLQNNLSPAQTSFLLCRELAFQYHKWPNRPYETRILEVTDFEVLLNNFRASYFASALIMNETDIVEEIQEWADKNEWDADFLIRLLDKYQATPEMLLQRLSNILPHHFGFDDLFFIRLQAPENLNHYRMTKELHLAQLQSPYANALNEHYCRRWVSVNIIKQARQLSNKASRPPIISQAQISKYWQTNTDYLCLSLARRTPNLNGAFSSVTLGLLVNETLRAKLRFLNHPALPNRIVHTTCERCGITDCEARVRPAVVLESKTNVQRIKAQLKKLD